MYLLNQWDPIAGADLAPEYDCLLALLRSRMHAKTSPTELAESFWYEIAHHFGRNPTGCDIDATANRLAVLAATWSPTEPPDTAIEPRRSTRPLRRRSGRRETLRNEVEVVPASPGRIVWMSRESLTGRIVTAKIRRILVR